MTRINIPFENIEQYRAMLEELANQSNSSLTPGQIDMTITSFSVLETSVLSQDAKPPARPQPKTDSYEVASAKVKEVMNQVYFGLKGRPDHFKTNFTGDIQAIAYDYFKMLLDDKYDVVETQPTDEFKLFSEDTKLFRAISAYRDFTDGRTRFLWVNHRDDKLTVAKILDKVENMTFTSWQNTHPILYTIALSKFQDDEPSIKTQPDPLAYVNNTYKAIAVAHARSIFEIGK